jgi:hypothetical protein
VFAEEGTCEEEKPSLIVRGSGENVTNHTQQDISIRYLPTCECSSDVNQYLSGESRIEFRGLHRRLAWIFSLGIIALESEKPPDQSERKAMSSHNVSCIRSGGEKGIRKINKYLKEKYEAH